MTEKHKAEEKNVMLHFRKLMDGFPKGRLVQGESPDYLLYLSAKNSVGIEITRIIQSDDDLNLQSHKHGQAKNKLKYFRISRAMVERAIFLKEEKLSTYRKHRANSYWLIIWIDEGDNFSSPRLSQNLQNHAFETRFNRVFLLLKSVGLVVELQKSSM
jgi:hypothetical protein